MRIEIRFFAALLPIATSLVGRIAVQGLEPALVSTVVEYGWLGCKAISGMTTNTVRSIGAWTIFQIGCGYRNDVSCGNAHRKNVVLGGVSP